MLSKAEVKLLYDNKIKKGMSKDQAYKAVAKILKQLAKIEKKVKK
jgi:hypothetical protein